MIILAGREARDTDSYEGAQVDEDEGLRDLGERLCRQGVQNGVECEEACWRDAGGRGKTPLRHPWSQSLEGDSK